MGRRLWLLAGLLPGLQAPAFQAQDRLVRSPLQGDGYIPSAGQPQGAEGLGPGRHHRLQDRAFQGQLAPGFFQVLAEPVQALGAVGRLNFQAHAPSPSAEP